MRVVLLLVLLALTGACLWLAATSDPLTLLRTGQQLFAAHIVERPLATAGGFFLLFTVLAATGLPGASLLMLIAGAGFGMVWGTLLALLASTTGATLSMLVARHWLRERVAARFGGGLARIDAGIARDGAFYLFGLRMAPLIPFPVLNPLLGLTAMPVWTYFWVSAAGMAAGTAAYVNAGLQLGQIDSAGDLVSPAVIASLALVGALPWLATQCLRRWRVFRG